MNFFCFLKWWTFFQNGELFFVNGERFIFGPWTIYGERFFHYFRTVNDFQNKSSWTTFFCSELRCVMSRKIRKISRHLNFQTDFYFRHSMRNHWILNNFLSKTQWKEIENKIINKMRIRNYFQISIIPVDNFFVRHPNFMEDLLKFQNYSNYF